MAEKLTNRTALTTPASGDLLHIVDISDTTDSPQGSSKKITFANLAAGITPIAAALTKTDDTNVTLTLGGSPSSALLAATSLTLGWTGTLADARIASAATWNAKESALTFSTGLTRTVNTITIDGTVVTLTGSQALSNKTGLISQWTNDSNYVTASTLASWAGTTNVTTLGTITTGTWSATAISKAKGGTGVDISSAALVLGTSSSAVGKLTLANATNGFTQSFQGTVVSADITYNLPTTAPTAGQVLQSTAPSAGVATLSWATASSGITVGTTTITSGTSTRIPFNDGGVYGEDADLTWDKTNNILNIGVATGTSTTNGINIGGSQFLRTNETGLLVGKGGSINGYSVGIGGNGLTIGANSISIGFFCGTGDNSLGMGYATGFNNRAAYQVMLGQQINSSNASTIVIGISQAGSNFTTATHQGILGIPETNGYIDNWYFNGVTHTAPYSVILNASGFSGTNGAGASFTISGGKGTGTGAAGDVVLQTSVKGASGTTLQSLGDSVRIIGKYVDLTESSATAFATVTVPTSGSAIGGFVHYTIEANDGTDYQSLSGYFPYSIVNKAGALTVSIGTETQTNAVSSGTLTATASITATGITASFKLNAVSSLTQTVLRCNSQVFKNFGSGVIASA